MCVFFLLFVLFLTTLTRAVLQMFLLLSTRSLPLSLPLPEATPCSFFFLPFSCPSCTGVNAALRSVPLKRSKADGRKAAGTRLDTREESRGKRKKT
jgi:hypothetical protein